MVCVTTGTDASAGETGVRAGDVAFAELMGKPEEAVPVKLAELMGLPEDTGVMEALNEGVVWTEDEDMI